MKRQELVRTLIVCLLFVAVLTEIAGLVAMKMATTGDADFRVGGELQQYSQ